VQTPQYTASRRPAGRAGWSISFRHPLRTDAAGKPGLKVHRGLKTTSEEEAERLVTEMNELLADERYWSVAARSAAEGRFSKVVVEAFYSGIESPSTTPFEIREETIPLPRREDGYATVLFVGTTGAGKTTLLRHMIGSNQFPSTATGRTTTADMEIVTAQSDYEAVVTFLSERAVRSSIQECIAEALTATWNGAKRAEVARRLLQHPNQTFRLNYTLGDWASTAEDEEEEGWAFGNSDESVGDDQSDGIAPDDERLVNQRLLEGMVDSVSSLARSAGDHVTATLGVEWSSLRSADLDAAEAMLVEEAESRAEHAALVDEIALAVKKRFERIDEGERLTRGRTGWPEKWEYTSSDREDFLRRILWFSSNYSRRFGRLLTPLVQGIRVRGAFSPEFAAGNPKLVLIDGQGLGHVAELAASVSTHITSRFAAADVILIVDSAQQPMQAAPLAALRAAAVGGHQEKVLIAFTHFDLVRGPNLPNAKAKREHVVAAVRNALAKLRTEIGESAIRSLDQQLESRCFTLGWMNQASGHLPPKVVEGVKTLLSSFEASIKPSEPIPVAPTYDPASLMYAVQAATRDFQTQWIARLGLGTAHGELKEHWTRIKALNRRIADRWDVEYDTLRPVADLYKQLTEEVSRFLEQPVAWEGDEAEDQDQRARALDSVRRSVSSVVQDLTLRRLIDTHIAEWVTAYAYAGRGSTFTRAQEIRDIFEEAAPIPGVVLEMRTKDFLDDVRGLVHAAIERGGGKVLYGRLEVKDARREQAVRERAV
jgi:hypothetical protein